MFDSLKTSIFGPLQFLLYINDLPNCLIATTPCLLADDTHMFTSAYDAYCSKLKFEVHNICVWLTVNKLQSDSSKSKLMIIGSAFNLNNKVNEIENDIFIDNTEVDRVKTHKSIGVVIDEKLCFENHIDSICKQGSSGIGALKRIKPYVTPSQFPSPDIIYIYLGTA